MNVCNLFLLCLLFFFTAVHFFCPLSSFISLLKNIYIICIFIYSACNGLQFYQLSFKPILFYFAKILCVCVCVPVCFIHPSVDGHLGQFCIYQSTWCTKYLCGVLA